MMKKFICISLAIAVLLGTILIAPVYAADPAMTVSVTAPNADGYFEAAVAMSDNPGIATFTLLLNFDKTKIQPVSITKTAGLTGDIISNFDTAIPNFNPTALNFVSVFWSNTSNVTTGSMTLYTVRFKVQPGVTGETAISLTMGGGGISNQAGQDVTFALGTATVSLDPTVEPDPEPPKPAMTVSATTPDANGYFDAVVAMSDNPGIATFTLLLNFDKTKIQPVSITKAAGLTGDIISNFDTAIPNFDPTALNFVSVFWSNTSNVTTGSMTLYTVRFKVQPGVTGETEINLTMGNGGISNQDGEDVDFTFGTATVSLDPADEPEPGLPIPADPGIFDGKAWHIPADSGEGLKLTLEGYHVDRVFSDPGSGILWEADKTDIIVPSAAHPFNAIAKMINSSNGKVRYVGIEKPVSISPGTYFDGITWSIPMDYTGTAEMRFRSKTVAFLLASDYSDIEQTDERLITVTHGNTTFDAVIKLVDAREKVQFIGIERK